MLIVHSPIIITCSMPQSIIQTTNPKLLSVLLMEIKLFILLNSPGWINQLLRCVKLSLLMQQFLNFHLESHFFQIHLPRIPKEGLD
ncbi:hypothetical protein VIGAN_03158800 [Vigna angularis var. angularis]|uniref:Uncharacterized protein n=1 Tax=Vigna angularis var. angularis TaxID=157739 RepID=A0A0S3RMV2_PHAAN|nr:hypothetical protein VIGAN_03158800 [Vigna angularis var. angularis]